MKKPVRNLLVSLLIISAVAGIAAFARYLRNATLESRTMTFTLIGLESRSLDSAAHYYRLAVEVSSNRETNRAREHLIRTYWYLSKRGADVFQQRVYMQLAREQYQQIETGDAPRGQVYVLHELVFSNNDSLCYDPVSDRVFYDSATR